MPPEGEGKIIVSVVIPAYNEEKYIRKALQALTELQKSSTISLEIIVGDNGSTDSTVSIVKEFPGVRLEIENTIRGANAARQKAFNSATGNIIISMDADCIPLEGWLKKGLQYFDNPKVISVAGIYLYENTFQSASTINYLAQAVLSRIHYILHNIFGKGGLMVGGNAFYRRESLEKIGGFAVDIPFWGDDAHTADQLAKHGRIIYGRDVQVITSSRRFVKLGMPKTMWLYIMNYIWTITKGKPYSKTIEEDVIR